ncbi:PFGI-1 class ICE element type IV pilus protein PilL2 [Lelliottia amnigena]|uniref:PFGI-1 class ICE element type IV pilus protein PilL2 n=1 Tax=Lelliottia amnigena TaxID=61646 RepID=UPI0040564C04
MSACCLSAITISPTLAMLIALTGCTGHIKQPSPTGTRDATAAAPHSPQPVIRYGRYTLVEMRPQPGQLDLSQQIVDVAMPVTLTATVGEGMQYLLQRTGYSLCQSDETVALYALPLPAPHFHLGPQTLRDALRLLAGPAWQLTLDQEVRQVCFIRSHGDTEATSVEGGRS